MSSTYFHSTNLITNLRKGLFKLRQNKTRSGCSLVTTILRFFFDAVLAAAKALDHALPFIIDYSFLFSLIFICQAFERAFFFYSLTSVCKMTDDDDDEKSEN